VLIPPEPERIAILYYVPAHDVSREHICGDSPQSLFVQENGGQKVAVRHSPEVEGGDLSQAGDPSRFDLIRLFLSIHRVVIFPPATAVESEIKISGGPPFGEITRRIPTTGRNNTQFFEGLDRVVDLL
jgi:hypothetical protein